MARGGWQAPQLSTARMPPAHKARAAKEGSRLSAQPQAGPGGQTSDPAAHLVLTLKINSVLTVQK